MQHVKVLFFATLRDRAGVRSVDLEVPADSTVAAVKQTVAARYPALQDLLRHTVTAVNREYVLDSSLIPPEAEIALFPPVSGG